MSECCAACGKAEEGLKACKACKLVKYCNVNCQVAHRSKHKKACRKRAAELFDEKLYADPPPRDECPICCQMLPRPGSTKYQPCCGKSICRGCFHCLTRDFCPFCNAPTARGEEEANKMLLERIKKYNDPEAMNVLGCNYKWGQRGFNIDSLKAIELFQRASELGCACAHLNLGDSYSEGNGEGIQQDRKKALHHYQIAAMLGNEQARNKLGINDVEKGYFDRGMRHFMIAAKYGLEDALDNVKKGYKRGLVTKEDFEKTLRAYQAFLEETRSEQRDRADLISKLMKGITS